MFYNKQPYVNNSCGCLGHCTIPVLFVLLLLFLISPKLVGQSYGLQFASRTSLDLTPTENICATRNLQLAFDLSFSPNNASWSGHVFRIINEKHQNLELLFDQHTLSFRINFDNAFTNIGYPVNPSDLLTKWVNFRLEINLPNGVSLYANNRLIKSTQLNLTGSCFKINFGAGNDAKFKRTDVTPMFIRNIGIRVNEQFKYYWPLNAAGGNTLHDSINMKKAAVVNPVWIIPKHTNWELVSSRFIKGTPSVAFDPAQEQLYIAGADSFYTLSAQTMKLAADALTLRHNNLLPGNQSIFNRYNNTLYNFYTDQHQVTEYNFFTHQWVSDFLPGPATSYWHVNKFFSRSDNALYIMGGFGQSRYKNQVHRYSLEKESWEPVRVGGDYFSPRYLAGLGTTASGDTAYILGGYGSTDAAQLLNPKYFYDLLRFDVKTKNFKKLFTLKEPAEPFVFANSLVLDEAGKNYYALIYPKDLFNTKLQLIRGSLTNPDYELLAKPFPYSFSDNRSFADLYYCPQSQLLLAVTQYTHKDTSTEVKIYSIGFPPNQLTQSNPEEATEVANSLFYIIGGLTALFLLFITLRYIRNALIP
jgi:hypothetical protein